MKKYLAILLAVAMLLSMTACGEADYVEEEEQEETTEATEADFADEPTEAPPEEIDLPASPEEALLFCIDAFCNGQKAKFAGSMPQEAWDTWEEQGYSYQDIYDHYDTWYADYITNFDDGFHAQATISSVTDMDAGQLDSIAWDLQLHHGLNVDKITAAVILEGKLLYNDQQEDFYGASVCYDGIWYLCYQEYGGDWMFQMNACVEQIVSLMGGSCGESFPGDYRGDVAVGDTCPSYTVYEAGEGNAINPTTTGKITIINFWGIWCGYCEAEMPCFDKLAANYADTVAVVAVHSAAQAGEGISYAAQNYPNSSILFACDLNGNTYCDDFYTMLGGSGSYPRTVILDANGVVVDMFDGMTTYEHLESIVTSLLNS